MLNELVRTTENQGYGNDIFVTEILKTDEEKIDGAGETVVFAVTYLSNTLDGLKLMIEQFNHEIKHALADSKTGVMGIKNHPTIRTQIIPFYRTIGDRSDAELVRIIRAVGDDGLSEGDKELLEELGVSV